MPSRLKPVPLKATRAVRGTGFSRDWTPSVRSGVTTRSVGTIITEAMRAVSRTGFSREALDLLLILIFKHKRSRHRQTRLGCRLNAGLAEWAERHGCRESRPPPWMADGGAPPARDRSEGTPRYEGPNQEQAPLVTWGAFPSNSPKAKQSAPRQTLLILRILILIFKRPPKHPVSSPLLLRSEIKDRSCVSAPCPLLH
jgi:hypothetical protein